MKFSCDNCQAKYQIADEKVAGRTLKMTCRHCGHAILIRGDAADSADPAPPAPKRPTLPHAKPAAPALPEPTDDDPLALPKLESGEPVWHVAIHEVPIGPVPLAEIERKIAIGAVTAESLCWREGLDDWKPLGEIPELAALLETTPEATPFAGRPSLVAPEAPPERTTPEPRLRTTPEPKAPIRLEPAAESILEPLPRNSSGAAHLALSLVFGLACGGVGYWLGLQQAPVDRVEQAVAAGVEPAPEAPPSREAAPETAPAEEEPAPAAAEAPAPEPTAEATRVRKRPEPRATASAPTTTTTTAPKPAERPLTAEEKRLLETYGGGAGTPSSTTSPSSRASSTTSLDSSSTPSGLDASAVQQVVSRNRASLQQCYERATRGAPLASTVRINVSVTVGASGIVTRAVAVGDNLPLGLGACIEAAVKRWHFPAGGEARFPVVFTPS